MDDERIARLETTVALWMKGADEFRQDQKTQVAAIRTDIKEVGEKVDALPCPVRIEATKGIKFQLALFWWIIAFVVTSIGGLTFNALSVSKAWGQMVEKVDRHETVIERLDSIHRTNPEGAYVQPARAKNAVGV